MNKDNTINEKDIKLITGRDFFKCPWCDKNMYLISYSIENLTEGMDGGAYFISLGKKIKEQWHCDCGCNVNIDGRKYKSGKNE